MAPFRRLLVLMMVLLSVIQCILLKSITLSPPLTLCPAEPCHTLSGIQGAAQFFTYNNTTMIFLPGNHSLDQNIMVASFNFSYLATPHLCHKS